MSNQVEFIKISLEKFKEKKDSGTLNSNAFYYINNLGGFYLGSSFLGGIFQCGEEINNNKDPRTFNYSAESFRAKNSGAEGASGLNALAFGENLTVKGESAAGFGKRNVSGNNETFVSGQGNEILGKYGFGAGGGNNKQFGDYGFVAGNKVVSLGIKNTTLGSFNFSGGTASFLSGEWNTEAYFALNLEDKKLYRCWVNPLNKENNIFDSENCEEKLYSINEKGSMSGGSMNFPVNKMPIKVTGVINFPGDIKKVINTYLSEWSVDGQKYSFVIDNEGTQVKLVYSEETGRMSITYAKSGSYDLNIYFTEEEVSIKSIEQDGYLALFTINSIPYFLGYDPYNNITVGDSVEESSDKEGNPRFVVNPKARCYKYNDNVYLFSLELDDYIPFNNIISGNSNKIKAGSNNIVSGDRNVLYSGSGNLLTGFSNKITGSFNASFGYDNTVDGQSNITVGTNNNVTSSSSGGSGTVGVGLKAVSDAQFIVGKYNTPSDKIAFAGGIGASDTERENAIQVHNTGAVVVPKVPSTANEVLRYSDLIPNSSGGVSTTNGFNVKFNNATASKFINKATGEDLIEKVTKLENKEVDSVLDKNSTNPVQNKVITEALDGKLDKVARADMIYGTNSNGEQYMYYARSNPLAFCVPIWNTNGCLKTSAPIDDNDTTPKKFVLDKLLTKADSEITHNGWKAFSGHNEGAYEFWVKTGVEYNPNAYIKGEITTVSELSQYGVYKTYSYYCKASDTLTFDDGFTVTFSQNTDTYYDNTTIYVKTNGFVTDYSLSILTELTEDLHKVVKNIEKDTIANESKIGDIETALDSIIKIQNSLIGGNE